MEDLGHGVNQTRNPLKSELTRTSQEHVFNDNSQEGQNQTLPFLFLRECRPVSNFLFQLIMMLAENKQPDIVAWEQGQIVVHDPPKLAEEVLHKYFRHSNFSSFQRQLNYFGFRKLAGKTKMSPCSYVNDTTSSDLQSLFFVKRRKLTAGKRKNESNHRSQRTIPYPFQASNVNVGNSSQPNGQFLPQVNSFRENIYLASNHPPQTVSFDSNNYEQQRLKRSKLENDKSLNASTPSRLSPEVSFDGSISSSISIYDMNAQTPRSVEGATRPLSTSTPNCIPILGSEKCNSDFQSFCPDTQVSYDDNEGPLKEVSHPDLFFDALSYIVDSDEKLISSSPYEPVSLDDILSSV